MALKIDIRSLEDVFRVQAATKGYNSPRYIMNVNNVSVFFDQVREILVGGLADNVFPIVFGFGYELDDR